MLFVIIHKIFSITHDWSKCIMWLNIPEVKLGMGISKWYSPVFKTAHVVQNIWRIINTIASIWHKSMFRYLSMDIIYSSKLEENCLLLRKDSVYGQISKHIFAPSGGYCFKLIMVDVVHCSKQYNHLINQNEQHSQTLFRLAT